MVVMYIHSGDFEPMTGETTQVVGEISFPSSPTIPFTPYQPLQPYNGFSLFNYNSQLRELIVKIDKLNENVEKMINLLEKKNERRLRKHQ